MNVFAQLTCFTGGDGLRLGRSELETGERLPEGVAAGMTQSLMPQIDGDGRRNEGLRR